MGEEYGETHPFPYFVDHSDPALIEAVRKGRGAGVRARSSGPSRRRSGRSGDVRIGDPRPVRHDDRAAPLDPRRVHRAAVVAAAPRSACTTRPRSSASSEPAMRSSSSAASETTGRCSSSTSAMVRSTWRSSHIPILTTVGSAERNQVSEEAVPERLDVAFDVGDERWSGATGAGAPAVIDGTVVHLEGPTAVLLIERVRRTRHAKPVSSGDARDTGSGPFSLQSTSGAIVSLSDFAAQPVLVVAFICNHCPYVRHIESQLAPRPRRQPGPRCRCRRHLGQRRRQLSGRRSGTPGRAGRACRFRVPVPLRRDAGRRPRSYGAVCTPDLFVFDADRRLAYRGEFDSSRPSSGVAATGESLRAALDHVLAGQPVPPPHRPSVGCSIKWRP